MATLPACPLTPVPSPLSLLAEDEPEGAPLFRFGVLGDVQYADAEDAWDFDKRHKRYYRGTLESVKAAVTAWNAGA